jgi:predicted membrane protein
MSTVQSMYSVFKSRPKSRQILVFVLLLVSANHFTISRKNSPQTISQYNFSQELLLLWSRSTQQVKPIQAKAKQSDAANDTIDLKGNHGTFHTYRY